MGIIWLFIGYKQFVACLFPCLLIHSLSNLLTLLLIRIFQLTKDSIITLDPSTFSVTNTFAYNSITKISPDDKEKDQFNVEYEKTTYVYKTTYRTKLLCELYHCVVTKIPNKYKSYGKS